MRLPAAFGALRHRAYRRVWAAGIGSQVGNWMQITGRAYLVFEVTGSTAALGTVYFFSYIPQLLFSQVAGVVADRYERRRVLVGCQFLATAGAVAMGVLAASGEANLWNVSAISFALGVVMSLLAPVAQAIVPSLVPKDDLTAAISLHSATGSATRVAGPLLAGLMIPLAGVEWLFFANAASYVVLIAVWAATPVPRQPAMEESRAGAAIAAAFRFVRRTPPVAVSIGVTAYLSAVGLVYQPLGVALATDVLARGDADLGARYFGLLQAAFGAGAVVGILGITGIAQRRPARALVLTAASFSVLLVALGTVEEPAAAFAVAVGIGATHFANSTIALNFVQHATPEVLRGRVMSIYTVAWIGLFPVSSVVAGRIAAAVGVQPTLLGAGLACVAFCVPLVRWAEALPDAAPDGAAAGLRAAASYVEAVPDEA